MFKHLTILLAMAALAAFAAGIPQEWAVDVARVKPHQIQAYHGDTMELKATYWLNGAPFDVGGESFRLYWQTNAMEEIYWSADATAASNTVSATFANTMDPGAPIVYGFLGSTGGNYRASFAIRFSPGPGAVPNALPLPQPTIDFAKVEVLNAPWQTPDYSPTNAELVATIEAVAPPADLTPATNYTDRVAGALSTSLAVAAQSATNYTDAARASLSTNIAVAAQSATNYTDSAIQALPSWAKAATKPTYTLNEVCPSTENWLGVPGTTAAGKSIKVLAKTVNGVVEGGLTVTGSSNNDNNTTKYRYGGVTATRGGVATDYVFDTTSQSGIVRRSELAGLATSQSLAAAAQAATNYTDSVAATKADLNTYTTPEFTTNDLWLCEWSGEVLPFRSGAPMAIWQKAYNAKPALMYIKSPVAWQLNPTGSTLLTITTTNATAAVLDFGSGYTLKRLTGPAHVVYRDELDRAIAAVPGPDYSTDNAELVATIEATAPPPGDYATVSNRAMTALQSYSETDPTVPSWAKAASKPTYTAAEVGAASSEEIEEVRQDNTQTRQIVTTWENFLDGSNVVFSITNYLSGVYNLDAAKLRILELREGEYHEVYNSRDEILLHIDDFSNRYVRVAIDAIVDEVAARLASKADRDWGKYTSAGGEAPSNTVYMTAPNTVFAGGLEYERVAVGEGTICVLTTRGAPVWTQGDEGTFKFQDDGGTNYFGFAKTDSYTIGANTDGITVQGGMVTLNYNITMSGRPCVWYKSSLSSGAWEQLNLPDGSPVAGASHAVTWEANPDPGTQVCYINVGNAPSGFFRATVEVAGEAKFMTNMPADLPGGWICPNTATGVDGVIKPTFNGTSVIWNWSAK